MNNGTIIRTACLVIALANMILKAFGLEVLPISDDQINAFVTDGAVMVTAIVGWWKNNSFSKSAVKADAIMKRLKFEKKATKKGYTVTSNEDDQNSISAILYEDSPVQATDEQIADAAKAEAKEEQDA